MKNIKIVNSGKDVIAIIVYNDLKYDGVSFITPNKFSLQLATMSKHKRDIIPSHIHTKIKRTTFGTQEILLVKEGKVMVKLYDKKRKYLKSYVLDNGDLILLASGGHGLEFLEDTKMIEIKQGRYIKNKDKIIFKNEKQKNIN
jgi:hypothetical protein